MGSIFAALISAKSYPQQITPALVGLAINYTFLVPIYLNWVVKFISEIEMYMGSVARINSFSNISSESQDFPFGNETLITLIKCSSQSVNSVINAKSFILLCHNFTIITQYLWNIYVIVNLKIVCQLCNIHLTSWRLYVFAKISVL